MAKTTYWTGAIDGDWQEEGNWSNGQPAADDTVGIASGATQAMDTNLDRSGDTAGAGLNLALFDVHEQATANIGASGSPLLLTADKMTLRGRNTVYYTADTGTGALDTDRIIIDCDGFVILDQTADTNIDVLEVLRGSVDLTLTRGITSLRIGSSGNASPPIVDISGIAGVSSMVMESGAVSYSSSGTMADLMLSGGEFVYTSPGEDLTTVEQFGGSFLFDGNGSIGSTYTLVGGLLDLTRTGGAKALTNIVVWPNASFLFNPDLTTKSLIEVGE